MDDDQDGFVAADDCDDTDPDIHPGALERCDGVDDACDGANETGAVSDDQGVAFADLQAALDGVADGGTITVCPGTYAGGFESIQSPGSVRSGTAVG